MAMSQGVRKLPIGGLSPDVNNALIVAVMIGKLHFKIFLSKKDSEERGVWNFTLRDSRSDTINATVWGSATFIQHTYEVFSTGDVVEILNPRVSFKQPDSADSVYNPAVTSPFQLHLQENYSEMLLYAEEDVETYRCLIRIPTKAPGDFLTLSDVYNYGEVMKGEYVNLLVALRNIGEIRKVKSKSSSRELLCRHITVMDQSLMEFHITLWDEDVIQRARNWKSRQTIIFFADVRLEWDAFRNEMTAIITARTIVTENPNTNEAYTLLKYAETAPIQGIAMLDHFARSLVDVNTINNIMTSAQVIDKAFCKNNVNRFTALVYVIITRLDLDGSQTIIIYKCSNCSQNLDENRRCTNVECLSRAKKDLGNPQISFNLRLNLSDHRGTLSNCRLVSPVADQILECSVQQFLQLTSEEKTKLKWRLLLTHCEARIVVLCTSPERPQPLISIVACAPIKLKDVASKLPIY